MEQASHQTGTVIVTDASISFDVGTGPRVNQTSSLLSDYLEDIRTICVGDFELDPLADFYYLALIPPLSILASRSDIHKNFPITVDSAVEDTDKFVYSLGMAVP
ncbi:hypothetical protein GLOIN_2v1611483 [Rhizophagus clarus]|uniref:Uncharacterized protein n=1 Tax=Rhizophagus clarus TaxID=94130 RepID=A0A8H3LA77_9GLOM|nr:hypothetical protein GLOIN_2v1611483 [Rhizophagus clarus]